MNEIIKEKLEEAWKKQDIVNFNALLELNKNLESEDLDNEYGDLRSFLLDEKIRRLKLSKATFK
ncbi:unnamed protein product [marine sediment metagenome]|uniref:Uncharacterized protein n=1 Tax=marine sediment metagenome TaxID=412755 RepID=X1K1W2_9ZZZZ